MRRLIAAEYRKLVTTRVWLWLLLGSVAWAAGYAALAIATSGRAGSMTPPLAGADGQHALFAISAGGAGPLAAILGAVSTAGEYRHRTAAATFLAAPSRARVVAAKLAVLAAAGACYGAAGIVACLAVALPWLRSRGIGVSITAHGDLAVLAAVLVAVALYAAIGAGLGALLGGELAAVAGLLLFLYILEPLISHIRSLGAAAAYLPGVAADGLTQASQTGVRLLGPWQGGLVLAAWTIVIAAAGTARTVRRDIT